MSLLILQSNEAFVVWEILFDESMHSFHLQRRQALKLEDYPLHVEFASWYMKQSLLKLNFSEFVIFTNEVIFTQGLFNNHNAYVWVQENTHITRSHVYQRRFSISVQAYIVHGYLTGQHIFPTSSLDRSVCIFHLIKRISYK